MNTAPFGLHGTVAATFALVAATTIGTPELAAQRQGPGARTAAGATAAERAIRLADELELTAEQRTQLESIRLEVLEARSERAATVMALVSEVRAGIREPEGMRQELAALREARGAGGEALRDRFSEVLTEDQKEQLWQMGRRGEWRRGGVPGRSRLDRQRGLRRQGSFDRGRSGFRSRARNRPGR